jgi:hypothetical protein
MTPKKFPFRGILAAALLLLLFTMIAPSKAWAGDKTRIQIVVKNLDGKPVDRASVVIRFVQGRSIVKMGKKMITSWETRTNQDGLAKVPEMPQGTVLIQVIAKGYQTFGQEFTVEEDDKTIEIKLNPPQPQHSVHQ